jgi:hypothetical protein
MPTPPRPTNRAQPPQRGQAPRGAPPSRIVRAPQPQGRTFQYSQRSAESVVEQRNRQSSRFDMALTGVTMYRPYTGENMIRILPPSWTELQIDKSGKTIEHYAYQVWLHKWVGTAGGTYPCLSQMRGESCPMCDEWQALRRSGDNENAKQMGVKEQWLFYLLDRKSDQRDKPVVWSISKMQDDEMVDAARGFNNETIFPDHPDAGYDLRFRKVLLNPREPKTARYSGYQFARDPSPIHDDPHVTNEILAWIEAHPIPDMIKYYDADYMESQLMGTAPAPDETLDDAGYQGGQDGGGDGQTDDPRYAETQYADQGGDGQADQGGDGYDPEAPDGQGGEYVEEALAEADAEAGEAAQAAEEVTDEDPVVDQPARQTRRPIASAAPRSGNSGGARPVAPRAAASAPRRPAPQAAPRSNTPQRPARR